ncbi:MAG: hypothetical protein K9J81_09895 [Desulfohalobiaceae bacterium]|nr:hypothetical protein [Desulfohalobiaceae bacterium]
MLQNRKLAALLLAGVVLVLGHSLWCLMQGKFQEAMVMAPVLVVAYVFGVARHDRPEDGRHDRNTPQDRPPGADPKDQE